MRHQKVGRKLSRTASHRKALLASLSTALIKHKKIRTTLAKAKETRRIIEPIITRARDAYLSEKSGNPVDVHARREVAKFIQDKDAVKMLFTDVAEKVGKRPGGYTRVLALGNRLGDGAEMAVIELVDYNEAQDTKTRAKRVERSKAAEQRRKQTRPAHPVKEEAATDVAHTQEEVEATAHEIDASAEKTTVEESQSQTDAIASTDGDEGEKS